MKTNFESEKPVEWYARLYRKDRLSGGHIIMLGSGNEKAARKALSVWPGGLQVGGGITLQNAGSWLDAGAGAVIVTSWIFTEGQLDERKLKQLSTSVGKRHLVLDLSCRRQGDAYYIVTDRWQTFTQEIIDRPLLNHLSQFCGEFLVHGVDVEGKCSGIETRLVELLGSWGKAPITYAGGIHRLEDIRLIERLGKGRIDFTVGSALDIFGGSQMVYSELAERYGIDR